MCVIIFVPKGETISKQELEKAWAVNPDGAGYAIQYTDSVLYERGFMKFNKFWNAIRHKIGREHLILHLRISTSNRINQLQCHPYDIKQKLSLKGVTTNPVVCMNGTIFGQKEYKGLNDTMSYIKDHKEAFKIVGNTQSNDLLDIIEDSTGSKWAMMTPETVLLSSKFTEYNGLYYSNLNHINRVKTYYYDDYTFIDETDTIKDLLIPKLWKQVKNDKKLLKDLEQHLQDYPQDKYYLWWLDDIQDLKDMISFNFKY